MMKCSGCAGCTKPCGKEEVPDKHGMVCYIVNSNLEGMCVDDLRNYFFDKEYDIFNTFNDFVLENIYRKMKEAYDERDRHEAEAREKTEAGGTRS
jgi:hypothetical protein